MKYYERIVEMAAFFNTTRCSFPIDFYPESNEVANIVTRRLSDLRGLFADRAAYDQALGQDDSVIYTVRIATPADGVGQLHFGAGQLMPGKIGAEFYFTKGHLHRWRIAAEIYVGVEGEGCILLEDERSGASQMAPLGPNSIVYVPGYTAHRTVNTGEIPLKYLGIYPAQAGHDYEIILARGFRNVIVEIDGEPQMLDRRRYLEQIHLSDSASQ